MAIRKTNRAIKNEENRKKLIASANDLFSRYSFSEVTVDDICQHAGLSKGTYYNIFSSKDSLLMVSEKEARSAYLSEHFVYEESQPFADQLIGFFTENFKFILQSNKEKAKDTYLSYIQTQRQFDVDNIFYHCTLLKLIERGLNENAFRCNLSKNELYHMLHDWIIGIQIGWCISYHASSLESLSDESYFQIIRSFLSSLLVYAPDH